MFKRLRMRLAMAISPELAQYAEYGASDMNRRIAAQKATIAKADENKRRGITGSFLDYTFGVSFHQSGIHVSNRKAMKTLMLPKPEEGK